MDTNLKIAQEIAKKIDQKNSEEDILDIVNSIIVNYNIESRERNNLTSLEILEEYLYCCEYEKMSSGTIQNYRIMIKKMLEKLQLPLNEIKTSDLRSYLHEYQKERGIKDSTLNKYREYLSSFFNWCKNEGYCDNNPASGLKPIRCEKKEKESFTQTELEIIRLACADERDAAIIEFLYSTGCRVSELCILKKTDIDWISGTVQLYGKGRKYRTGFLNAKAIIYLKRYLDTRKDNEEWLFLSKRGSHQLHSSGIQKILRDIQGRTNGALNKNITPHVFRHTTATTALQNGMPICDIQVMLGHQNIDTTMVYAKTNKQIVQMNHKKYVI